MDECLMDLFALSLGGGVVALVLMGGFGRCCVYV